MIPIEEYEEILKCSKNEEYFINKYIKPIKEFNITEKISVIDDKELVIGYLLHKVIFNFCYTVLLINNTLEEKKLFFKEILHINNKLPDILKLKINRFNYSEIFFENGSRIINVLNSHNCCKSITTNFLILNQIEDDKNIIEMIYPMMSCNKDSKIIKLSL